uniref:hypothetical protein n=1 Tax=Methylocystis iwaonis TaxID=2885079 RepID=UPI002E7B4071|nr:hypothetical protein [Methylocystis iwaonis]
MSFETISANQGALFDEFPASESPAPRIRSPRSANRAAAWGSDLARSVSYLMGQCRSDAEREFISRLYDEAADRGPDFINYRSNSAFRAAPRLGIDRNAYARILNALEAIERGTYRHSREKGKQGIPRTVARVLKALLNLALQYGEVRPSLEGLGKLACVCKQTVVNCLKVLQLYGFVVVHRRIKRIRTPLGFKVVQDTNAYTIQEPQGLGAMAVRLFRQASESRKSSPSSKDSSFNKTKGRNSAHHVPIRLAWGDLREAWEAF